MSATALSCAVIATVLVPLAQPTAIAAEPPTIVLGSPDLQRELSDAVLSADGRQVGFLSKFGDTPSNYEVRDLMQGTTTAVPTGVAGEVETASMSGSGRLLSFTVAPTARPGTQTLFAVDREAPSDSQVHQVTGTTNDLPYLRMAGCVSGLRSCPEISEDGSTLVAGVYQSIQSPSLELTLGDGTVVGNPDGSSFEPLIDFSSGTGSTVELHVEAREPVVFPETGPQLSGDSIFELGTSTAPCSGPLAAGQQCTVVVSTRSVFCGAETALFGQLRLPGATPAGQTAISLLVDCPVSGGDLVKAVGPAATARCSGGAVYDGPAPTTPRAPHEGRLGEQVVSVGQYDVGELQQFSVQVINDLSTPSTVNLETDAACPFKLVVPKSQPTDACQPGGSLEPSGSCVAYVEFKATEIAPYAGEVVVGATRYRLVASGSGSYVAAWRDPSGQGNFAAAGPPRIVSVTGPDGTPMDGSDPSVSSDGRWVAYTSSSKLGRPAADTTNRQVYVHDTNADGAGGHGQTVIASMLPDGRLLPSASRPSLSGDGSRVAFADTHEFEPEPIEFRQVYVRDLPAQRTIVASSSPTGADGDDYSTFPVLSNDGRSVVYQSTSRNLMSDPLPGDAGVWQVYVRDVDPDFAGGRGVNQLMSVTDTGGAAPGTGAYRPAVNANGSVVAFHSDAQLTADDVESEPMTDVYVSTRAGELSASPASFDFGQVPVKTKSTPRVVTITNSGGPATIGEVGIDPPFLVASDQCSNTSLRGGESCAIGVTFAPTQVGARDSQLYVPGPPGTEAISVALAGTGTSDATTPGETKLVSVDDDPSSAIANSAPSISNDGRYVAFQSLAPAGSDGGTLDKNAKGPKQPKVVKGSKGVPAKKAPKDRRPRSAVVEALTGDAIHLRDQATGTTERLSPPEHVPYGRPDVSGDAQLVSYLGMTRDENGNALDRTANVYAVNRQNPAAPVVRAVSGTPTDLPYQRTNTYCAFPGCDPRLSDDGTAVVFSARQSWYSQSLSLQVPYQGGLTPWDLVDFAPTQAGATPYTQQVTVQAYDAVDFAGGPVVDAAEGAFRINGTTCGASLAAGQTCTIDLEFVGPRCGETFTGTLRTQGRIPAGQTAVSLVGSRRCGAVIKVNPAEDDEAKPGADAPNCAAIPAPATAPSPTTGGTTPIGNVEADSARTEIGKTAYVGLIVTNTSPDPGGLNFETPQCGMAFVTPGQPSPDYPTCTDGQQLAAGASCAAYVGFQPETFGTVLANLTLGGTQYKVHRFIGTADRDIVLMRRDPSGNGDFAGAGSLAPEIVSLDGNDAPMNGETPVVSGDGRYVGFISEDPVGRDTDDGNWQLYLRDRTAKTTKLVSLLPDGTLDEFGTVAPSISRDGSRIAFQAGPRGEGPTPPYSQIYVRDLGSGRTLLASAAFDDPGTRGNSDSYDPALSDDGTTVAFSSLAENLVDQPGNGRSAIYVREVERDFAGDSPRDNEIVSLTNEGRVVDGSSYRPAVNDDGAFVAFGSTGALVPEDTDESAWDVYVRRRFAQLVVEPAALDFGKVKVGESSGPKRVTVRNTGSGPADIGTVTAAAPFAPGAETCAKLRRGKSCTVDATFAPTAEGTFSGALNLPVSQGYLSLPPIGVTLAGVGEVPTVPPVPTAAYSVSPASVDFGDVTLGKEAAPASLTVKNTGQVPLAMTVATESDGDVGDYAADGTPCAVVMPAQSCVVPVRFAPRGKGTRTGAVTFTADAQDPTAKDPAPVDVSLTGTGVEPATGPTKVAAMTVTPVSLAFPAGILNLAGAPKRAVVRNVGDVPLAVAGEVRSGATEFYSRSANCLILLPGKQCAIDVRFAPRALGARVGALTVLAASIDPLVVSPFPVKVTLTGPTKQPKLVLDPTVGRPGQVTMVRGENFPPSQQIALSWQLGLGTALAKPDATGTFTVPMLVYRRDMLGDRMLAAAIPSLLAPTLSDPYLVEPLSGQPPGFFFRW